MGKGATEGPSEHPSKRAGVESWDALLGAEQPIPGQQTFLALCHLAGPGDRSKCSLAGVVESLGPVSAAPPKLISSFNPQMTPGEWVEKLMLREVKSLA